MRMRTLIFAGSLLIVVIALFVARWSDMASISAMG